MRFCWIRTAGMSPQYTLLGASQSKLRNGCQESVYSSSELQCRRSPEASLTFVYLCPSTETPSNKTNHAFIYFYSFDIQQAALSFFPLPSFPLFPLLSPCHVVLFAWKKTSSRSCQVWHQLILIQWCPAESYSDKHLLSFRAPRLLAVFCFHCRLFSDTLLLLIC